MDSVFEMVADMSDENTACYFAVRKSEANAPSTKWVLVMFVPSWSKVKDKMLYAATRDTLKRQLGANNFAQEALCSEKAELNWKVIQEDESIKAPLTKEEQLEKEDKLLEVDSSAESKSKALFTFPVTPEALDAIKSFQGGKYNFVQLKLDISGEKILLDNVVDGMLVGQLADQFKEHPVYSLYNLSHVPPSSDDPTVSAMFYMCVPNEANVKQKMLAATLKPSVVQLVESCGITIAKQFDTDNDNTDVTESALLQQLYGQLQEQKAITKDVKRAGKGGRKMVSKGRPRKILDDGDDD